MPWTEINGVPTFVAADATTSPSPTPGPGGGKKKSWFARHKVATAALAAVAVIGGASAFSGGSDSTTASQAPSSTSAGSTKETAKDAPLTNRDKADKAVDAVDDAKVTAYGAELQITFPIHDNLTEGLRRAGIAKDTFALLKALKNQGVEFDLVTISGTFDMLDAYGAEQKGEHVFNADFTHATVNRIQYDNIATTELDTLERFVETDETGDAVMWLHPAFGWKR